MRCEYCGKKIRDTAKFCSYCGKENKLRGSVFAKNFDSSGELLVVKERPADAVPESPDTDAGERRRLPVKYILTILLLTLICAGVFAVIHYIIPEARYSNAKTLYSAGGYREAEKAFLKLGDYKDSGEYVIKSRYELALALMRSGFYPEAADTFTSLDGYKNSDELAAECMLKMADECVAEGNLETAASVYAAAGKPELIKPAATRKAAELAENGSFFAAADAAWKYGEKADALEYRYKGALQARENGDSKTAADNFYALGEYKNSAVFAKECAYSYYSAEYEKKGASEEIVRGFYFLGKYEEAQKLYKKAAYEYGEKCYDEGDFAAAASMFRNSGSYKKSAEMLYKARYALGDSLSETDPASARSVFALMSTYSDSAKKKKAAAAKLDEYESWYADGYTSVNKYCTTVFRRTDTMTVFCTAGTDLISEPVTLNVTFRDSSGSEISADCENIRNSGSFSVKIPLYESSPGGGEIIISRKDNGIVLRRIAVLIENK